MRADFQHQLASLRGDLAGMCELAGNAVDHATCGLLEIDADVARRVSADVERLRSLHNAVERQTLGILARQAPVAGDLRTVVAGIHIAADADRMGALASHIAKLCLRRHPEPVIPHEMRGLFQEMGRIAAGQAARCRVALLAGDAAEADRVRHENQSIEALHQELFHVVTGPRWRHGPGAAADVVLLGRFYGRFADHADGIARRVIFQTGGTPVGRVHAV